MFIFSSRKLQIEKILSQGAYWIWRGVAVCFVAFSLVILFIFFSKSPYEKIENAKKIQTSFVKPAFSKIGEGSLDLQGFTKITSLPDLTQELGLLSKNPHPEVQGKKGDFLLYLKSSGSEYKAKSGEQIFLSCDSLPGGLAPVYRFSDQKTPLWIKPEFSGKEDVLLEVGLFTLSKESGVFQEEKMQIALKVEPKVRKEGETLPFIEILEKSKLWGQDVVLSRFAGEKYSSLREKVKLEIYQQGRRVFCFLGKGDLLRFDQGEWTPIEQTDSDEECPIAQVKKATPKTLELEVWDPNAFCSFPIKLESGFSSGGGGKGDCHPQSVREKSGKQVTCSFGKRRYVIKEGDWVLKTKRGWRCLRRSLDKEAYLCHKINGELFVFESLVKEQGNLVMKGSVVDEMRTHASSFSTSVMRDTKQPKAALRVEKKEAFLKKGEPTPTTYLFPSSNKKMNEGNYE